MILHFIDGVSSFSCIEPFVNKAYGLIQPTIIMVTGSKVIIVNFQYNLTTIMSFGDVDVRRCNIL